MKIVLGTRGSALALNQSNLVADQLRAFGHDVAVRTITTQGDVTSGSLLQAGGVGVFAAALREAVVAGQVDMAVHSFKDLPTAPVADLVVAAVPTREDARDALCSRGRLTLAALPTGARVGTGSPRRAAQLRALRPDLTVVEIRGNVPTRLARALGDNADLDAVVLAAAGLRRLGLDDAIAELLDLLPAPAQGALALECRSDHVELRQILAELDDPAAHAEAVAERAILAELGAGCAAPIGARAVWTPTSLTLTARVISPDGRQNVTVTETASPLPDPDAFGRRIAQQLVAQRAADITPLGAHRPSQLADFHDDTALWAPGTATHLVGRRILLPRRDGTLADALREAGADVTCEPVTRTDVFLFPRLPRGADWVVFTSPTAVRVLLDVGYPLRDLGRAVAAVGPATRRALEERGVQVALTPEGSSTQETLAHAFPSGTGRVLIPGSELSRPVLAQQLRSKGWMVVQAPIYTTVVADGIRAEVRQAWQRGDFDAVVITAGSVASALVELMGRPPASTTVVAFGPPSAHAASRIGLDVAAIAPTQDGPGLVAALSRVL